MGFGRTTKNRLPSMLDNNKIKQSKVVVIKYRIAATWPSEKRSRKKFVSWRNGDVKLGNSTNYDE